MYSKLRFFFKRLREDTRHQHREHLPSRHGNLSTDRVPMQAQNALWLSEQLVFAGPNSKYANEKGKDLRI